MKPLSFSRFWFLMHSASQPADSQSMDDNWEVPSLPLDLGDFLYDRDHGIHIPTPLVV